MFLYIVLTINRSVNVSIPRNTRNNGTLFAHVFVYPHGLSPFDNYYTSYAIEELTVFAIPKDESVHLLSNSATANNKVCTVSNVHVSDGSMYCFINCMVVMACTCM